MKSGIYQIVNTVNNKRYIGSSYNIPNRFRQHRYALKNNSKGNLHLRNAWNKYGSDKFIFEVIEYCEINTLAVREQYHIDKHSFKVLYNKREDATSNVGHKFGPLSEEHRAKISGKPAWNKGIKGSSVANSGSFKKGMNTWNKGIKTGVSWNRGTKGKQTAWNKGFIGITVGRGSGTKPSAFAVVSPLGIYYEGNGVRKFAEFMGLTTYLLELVKGNIETYKGWTLPKDNEVYNGYGFFPTDNKLVTKY